MGLRVGSGLLGLHSRPVFSPRVNHVDKIIALYYNIGMAYKVVETSTVTDEEIEQLLNQWTAKGFFFESIHFVTTESSRRPKMAFLFFTKKDE
jgi:hypothetical protein